MDRPSVPALYERYNAICNRHAFDELRPFVVDVVVVNGRPRTAEQYAADLVDVHRLLPDYRWEMQRTVFEEPWLAVHFRDAGTYRGQPVTTDEFAMYRFAGGRIAAVWVTADNGRLPLSRAR